MKKILYLTLVFMLLFSGVGLAQDATNNQVAEYENKQFVYDKTNNGVLSQMTMMDIQENAANYYKKHQVEFYTQVVTLEEGETLKDSLFSLTKTFSQSKLNNKAVVLFVFDENTGQYSLYIDNKLKEKLNYYMIYNFVSTLEEDLKYNNLEQSLGNNINRLMDYFVLATEAVVGSSQFEVNYEKAQSLEEIQFYNLSNVYEEAIKQESTVQEKETVETPEESEKEEQGSIFSYIVYGIIIILIILLIGGIIWFIKNKNNSSEEMIYEEVEEIEDEEEYLD